MWDVESLVRTYQKMQSAQRRHQYAHSPTLFCREITFFKSVVAVCHGYRWYSVSSGVAGYYAYKELPFSRQNHEQHVSYDAVQWLELQKKKVNKVLIEFITSRNHLSSAADLSPSTLRNYICVIKRVFRSAWGHDVDLITGPVFGDKQTGVVPLLENKVRELQGEGAVRKSQNVLSEEDVRKMYKSRALSPSTPHRFVTRVIFNIALITAFRPGELKAFRMKNVTTCSMEGGAEPNSRILGTIGGRERNYKKRQGGIRDIEKKVPEFFTWDRFQCDGPVNVYANIMG